MLFKMSVLFWLTLGRYFVVYGWMPAAKKVYGFNVHKDQQTDSIKLLLKRENTPKRSSYLLSFILTLLIASEVMLLHLSTRYYQQISIRFLLVIVSLSLLFFLSYLNIYTFLISREITENTFFQALTVLVTKPFLTLTLMMCATIVYFLFQFNFFLFLCLAPAVYFGLSYMVISRILKITVSEKEE